METKKTLAYLELEIVFKISLTCNEEGRTRNTDTRKTELREKWMTTGHLTNEFI